MAATSGTGGVPPTARVVGIALALAPAALALLYWAALSPGAGDADNAELQAAVQIGGPVHAPGYPIFRTVAAWWIALFTADTSRWLNVFALGVGLFGVGCFGAAIHRLTGSLLAAAVGSLTLGAGNIYWAHSTQTEVYVFYSAFLIVALYVSVRSQQQGQPFWLALAALLLGVAVADRISELAVLPAFLFLWWPRGSGHGKSGGRGWFAYGMATILFFVPFVYSLTFLTGEETRTTPVARDEALRHELLGQADDRDGTPLGRAAATLAAARWHDVQYSGTMIEAGRHYAGMVTGHGPWKIDTGSLRLRGTSLGWIGLGLAGLGLLGRRRRWQGFALLLIAGNFAFYLYHRPPNHLDFTLPGMIGWGLLVALGTAWLVERRGPLQRLAAVALLVPVLLWMANHPLLEHQHDSATVLKTRAQQLSEAADSIPPEAVIVAHYREGMWYRLVLQGRAGRSDIQILLTDPDQTGEIVQKLLDRGRTVLVDSRAAQPPFDQPIRSGPLQPFGLILVAPPGT